MLFRAGLLCLAILAKAVSAEDHCTAVGVTKGASTDGSTMVSHNNDCGRCDTRIVYVPARDWPEGTQRPIYGPRFPYPREVNNRTESYLPSRGQMPDVPVGYIPEVSHTYGYWEAVYAYYNEHGLSLAESTAPTRLKYVAKNDRKALMWIRPLTQIAMERCQTARCAVRTMGTTAEKYGYYGETPADPEYGESVLLADGHEVWVLEIIGDLPKGSAFWVARKVEDGHIVALANHFTIGKINCADHANFECSADLLQRLKQRGLWDGHGEFFWNRAFSVVDGFRHAYPMYAYSRIWRIFSQSAREEEDLKFSPKPKPLPFSMRVGNKISHRMLMDMKRDHYEGTEIDLTMGPLAGPFGNPYRNELGKGLEVIGGEFPRSIAIQRTCYGTIGQTYATEAQRLNKMWFAADNPASSVYVPFYANASGFAASYRTGHRGEYNDRSAWWVFDMVANWMELNYVLMSVDVKTKVIELSDRIDSRLPAVERKAIERMQTHGKAEAFHMLSKFQEELQDHVVNTWRAFGNVLFVKYNDGYLNLPKFGEYIGYPAWWLATFGVDKDVRPKWAMPSASSPLIYKLYGPGPYDIPLQANLTGIQLASTDITSATAASSGVAISLVSVAVMNAACLLIGWVAHSRYHRIGQGRSHDRSSCYAMAPTGNSP